jgi:phosphoglycolate phosphatase-like HAD superfamily hydrolase
MFDVDGTLVDSYEFDEDCYLKAAEIVLHRKISSDWNKYSNTTDAGILNEAIDMYSIPGNRNQIQQNFERVFLSLISEYISKQSNSISEIVGASRFIDRLKNHSNVRVAIATGGFEETAKLKLKAAGINIQDCAFASSSDHYSRTEIMKIAESRACVSIPFSSKSYFGDAAWDMKASTLLKYRFVLVGSRISWSDQINDFQDIDSIMSMLSL